MKAKKRNNVRKLAAIKSGQWQNRQRSEQLDLMLTNNLEKLDADQYPLVETLLRRLNTCGSHMIFRNMLKTNELTFCGAKTCNHRMCSICNYLRSKLVRYKYITFFDKNPQLLKDNDAFHLVLTVPHDRDGYQGEKFYAKIIKDKFARMRECKWFRKMVYGGFYALEITLNNEASGLHIHIHAFLLVRKTQQNRNTLYKKILAYWNRATKQGNDIPLSQEQMVFLNNVVQDKKLINKLKGNGATMIWLESLYVTSKKKKKGYKYDQRTGLWKKYVYPGQNDFVRGVIECIKYHFEPTAIGNDGLFDLELLKIILPNLRYLRLYDKFGKLSNATKDPHPDAYLLNISTKIEADDWIELSDGSIEDPETGTITTSRDYKYLLVGVEGIRVNDDEKITIPHSAIKRSFPPGTTLKDAFKELIDDFIETERIHKNIA